MKVENGIVDACWYIILTLAVTTDFKEIENIEFNIISTKFFSIKINVHSKNSRFFLHSSWNGEYLK